MPAAKIAPFFFSFGGSGSLLQNKYLISCLALHFALIYFSALSLSLFNKKSQANQCIDFLQKALFLPDASDAFEMRTVVHYFFM